MIRLGEKQKLAIVKEVNFGVYLAEPEKERQESLEERLSRGWRGEEREGYGRRRERRDGHRRGNDTALLPAKQVPKGAKIGDEVEVFIYKDSMDRTIATTKEPGLVMGEVRALTVVSIQEIGAFLDWGLVKDLFLPYKEQIGKLQEGDQILVRLYVDKSRRLCASMRELYPMLRQDPPYESGDMVKGRVYEFSNNFGAFIAVDDQYSALLPRHEDHSSLRIGECVEARVVGVKPDGKLDLTLRDKAYLQINDDAQKIWELLDKYDGELPFNDKASPEVIMEEAKMSKNAFKRAVGRLYRERKIAITENGIQRK